ncbi:MAG: sulfite exporter TauE/SafE family protein [Pseudomonadota bacterium]
MEQTLVLFLGLIGAGCLAGIVAGLLGVGGGIIMVPVMTMILATLEVPLALSMHIAVATSLSAIIATGTASARAHWRRDSVDLDAAWSTIPFICAGAFVGALLARYVDGDVLRFAFAALCFFVAFRMLRGRKATANAKPLSPGQRKGLASAVGLLAAWLGIGGGLMFVALLRTTGMTMHRAVGTAALLGVAVAIPGSIGFVISGWNVAGLPDFTLGYVHWAAALALASTAILFAPLGAKWAHLLPQRRLQQLFGVFLILAGSRIVASAF